MNIELSDASLLSKSIEKGDRVFELKNEEDKKILFDSTRDSPVTVLDIISTDNRDQYGTFTVTYKKIILSRNVNYGCLGLSPCTTTAQVAEPKEVTGDAILQRDLSEAIKINGISLSQYNLEPKNKKIKTIKIQNEKSFRYILEITFDNKEIIKDITVLKYNVFIAVRQIAPQTGDDTFVLDSEFIRILVGKNIKVEIGPEQVDPEQVDPPKIKIVEGVLTNVTNNGPDLLFTIANEVVRVKSGIILLSVETSGSAGGKKKASKRRKTNKRKNKKRKTNKKRK